MKIPQFIIITDRASLKAGWISPASTPPNLKAPTNDSPHLEIIEEHLFPIPHQRLVDQMSDMAGAYSTMETSATGGSHGNGTPNAQPRRGPSSPSEVHWRIEADRRALENLAGAISSILSREKPEHWSLSAPQDIHKQLVAIIPKIYLDRLAHLLPKNLAHSDDSNIIAHFTEALPDE